MHQRPVADIIRHEALRAAPAETVLDVARRMAGRKDSCILVCDGDELAGIFTERDLLVRVVAAGRDPAATRIDEVMTPDPDSVDSRTSVADAIRRMDECGYRHLPVVDAGRIVGALSFRELPLVEKAHMQPELDARHALAERMW
ncbi:MAG: CBS domain-containing protein [Geminicoccaceae bacterium]|nr:CBS domain-containing protein [Geminicoccaceae bacterium]